MQYVLLIHVSQLLKLSLKLLKSDSRVRAARDVSVEAAKEDAAVAVSGDIVAELGIQLSEDVVMMDVSDVLLYGFDVCILRRA